MIAEIKAKSIFVFNLFVVWIFFLLRLLRVSINPPCTETKYCYHVMAGAFYCYFDELDRLQNRVYRAAEPWLVVCLQPLVYFRHLASLRLFYRYYFGKCSCELAELVPLSYSRGSSTHHSDRLHNFCHHCYMLQRCLCQQFLTSHS